MKQQRRTLSKCQSRERKSTAVSQNLCLGLFIKAPTYRVRWNWPHCFWISPSAWKKSEI